MKTGSSSSSVTTSPSPERECHDTKASKASAVQVGIKAMDEGRAVPHGKVKAWLESWGAEKELPAPECE